MMVSDMFAPISQKFYRAGEALHLIASFAADLETRRNLLHVYASLGKPERYKDEVALRFRVEGAVFPVRIRIEDIFVFGEILHERQYALDVPVPRNGFIIDAGANIGVATIWFLAQCPAATVHLFEPESENFRLLSANLGGNPRVRLFQNAVGRENGTAVLHLGDFGATHSVIGAESGAGGRVERIPLITLASHLEDHGIDRVDLLKLDVEGAELDALVGLGERIRDVRVIIGETHEAMVDVDAFYRYLEEAGFEIRWKRRFHDSEKEQVHMFEAVQRA